MKNEESKIVDRFGKPINTKKTRFNINKKVKNIRNILMGTVAVIAITATVTNNIKVISSFIFPKKNNIELTDIISSSRKDGTWSLDFRLLNNEGKTITINQLILKTISYSFKEEDPTEEKILNSYQRVTANYEIDLIHLRKPKDRIERDISQTIKTGASDRFKVILGLQSFNPENPATWVLEPTLVTSEGKIVGAKQTVRIPGRNFSYRYLIEKHQKEIEKLKKLQEKDNIRKLNIP